MSKKTKKAKKPQNRPRKAGKDLQKKVGKKPPKIDLGHVEKTIIHIIAEIAEVDTKKIKPNARFAEDLNINSMMALEILTAIEKTYKIEIPEESLPKMTSLKEVMKLVKELLP